MSTTGKMKHLMIAAGFTACLFFGAAAQAGAVSFGTNGGSYSFTFEENNAAQIGHPPTTNNPAAAYARAPLPGASKEDTSARPRSSRTAVDTNGGTYSFDH